MADGFVGETVRRVAVFFLALTSSVAVCLRLFTIGGSTATVVLCPLNASAFKGNENDRYRDGLNIYSAPSVLEV